LPLFCPFIQSKKWIKAGIWDKMGKKIYKCNSGLRQYLKVGETLILQRFSYFFASKILMKQKTKSRGRQCN